MFDDLTTPKTLQEALDALDEKRVKLAALKDKVVIAEKAKEVLRGKYRDEIGLSVSWEYGEPSVSLSVPVARMQDSAHMLTYLSTHGLKRLGDGTVLESTGTKMYSYEGHLHVNFNPPVDGDGLAPGCRRVIDGYRQVPIYKIVCDKV